jgi:hypothetical protein
MDIDSDDIAQQYKLYTIFVIIKDAPITMPASTHSHHAGVS